VPDTNPSGKARPTAGVIVPLFLDAGGPFLLVFYGGAIVGAVLGVVGLVMGGLWIARRVMRNDQPHDPESYS
jgi:hypothetical protein